VIRRIARRFLARIIAIADRWLPPLSALDALQQAERAIRCGAEHIGGNEQRPGPPTTTARILHRDGRTTSEVEARSSSVPGLLLTRSGPVWQLTHEASGARVANGRSWMSPEAADEEARRWLAPETCGVDWRLSRERLHGDKRAAAAVRRLETEGHR